MHVQARSRAGLALTLAIAAALAGCNSIDGAAHRVANAVTPYKVDVVQGNFVSKEQVEALQPGMSRQQIRDILGTPS
jgi:outer membrane protein assembly factor BamE